MEKGRVCGTRGTLMSQLRQDLTVLYDKAGRELFGCALAVTGSGDLAEDAVHDAFFRALRLAETPQNLRAYMFRAVRNTAVDILRRQSRTVQSTTEDVFDRSAVAVWRRSGEGPDLERVLQALNTLSDDERETVLEHLVAGLTFREIAELRERPIGTVATWYRRSIEKIRERVRPDDGRL